MQKNHLEKEWSRLLAAEGRFLERNTSVGAADWQEKIAKFMPQKLEATLNTAFFKAFELIFDKGTPVIEKTYQKQKKEIKEGKLLIGFPFCYDIFKNMDQIIHVVKVYIAL